MKKTQIKNIALTRIKELFDLAKINPDYEKRYLELSLKISQKTKTPIPKELKRKICKNCLILLNSRNSTQRIRNKVLTINCKNCNKTKRIPTTKK
ncbi:MAG TPA: ribonuclease P [Candidatus Nanoarchaeia archaeon]|nr:ribonuclease P [Candidatus Nanoarchaeia archaeon]